MICFIQVRLIFWNFVQSSVNVSGCPKDVLLLLRLVSLPVYRDRYIPAGDKEPEGGINPAGRPTRARIACCMRSSTSIERRMPVRLVLRRPPGQSLKPTQTLTTQTLPDIKESRDLIRFKIMYRLFG